MAPEELADFLGAHPPFDSLSDEELRAVCASASRASFRAGQAVVVEDGPPVEHLYVVLSGLLELQHEEETINELGPGECFGHTSLLTGMAPTFTVYAREDSTCCLIGLDQALTVLGRPDGVRYVALADRDRLTLTGHTVHALPDVHSAQVGKLVLRPPLFCEPETTIREAAQLLTDQGETAALVRTAGGLAILTDADLRERVVAGPVPVDAPVSAIAHGPVPSVPADQLAIDATIDMLDGGFDHLAVLGTAGEPVGVISAAELAGLDTHSPFALRHTIINARSEDAVVEAALQARQVFRWLFDAGLSSSSLGRVLTLQADAIVSRLLYLSIARHGPVPVPWAWLALGSGARREFTLGSDQDNALAYGDSDEDVDAYFERLGSEVNEGMVRCGFKPDANDVLAGKRNWRMSQSAWERTFEECLDSPDNSRLIRATVAFDFRQSDGPLRVSPPLVKRIRRAGEHPQFIRQLARVTEGYKPPLGFRGTITPGPDGKIDIKRGGIIPLVNLARFHAFSNGITISSTIDRLAAAKEIGALDAETAEALLEAFEIVCRVRFKHHADCVDADQPIDDLVDPDELSAIRRRELRDVFRTIARTQKRLSVYLPPGL